MPPIRHIVFDIGKVLIHYDPNLPFARLLPDPEKRSWFFANVCTDAWNVEQDRGRAWAEAEAELVARFPDHEENIRGFRKHWHEMVPHAYADSVAVLERLVRDGHDVTMLTNWARDTFAESKKRFPFLALPRGVTVSGEIGLIKPDPAIYAHHARTFGLDPAATLFIDDNPANVEGARAAGWQAIRFEGAEKLREDLRGFGIRA
jgi:2-haloacid dehalogenase